jgi:hypothetical protein
VTARLDARAVLPDVASVDLTDTQPIPVPDDEGRNLLYTPLRIQVTNGSTDADEQAAEAMAEAEAAILDRLAEKTAASSPWHAALVLFGTATP